MKIWTKGLIALAGLLPACAFAVDGTFGAFVHTYVANGGADQAFVYTCASAAGVCAHYWKAWLQYRANGNLWSYLLAEFPGRTFAMVGMQIVIGAFAGLSGAWDSMTWGMLVTTAFTAGYAVDSMINKGEQPGAST